MSGCATGKHVSKEDSTPKNMMGVYASATGQSQRDVVQYIQKNLKEQKTFGYTKPYIPIINEPVVRKVWIPDHKSEENSDVLVAGHWLYLMIQAPTWFIENKKIDTKFPIIVPIAPDNQTYPIQEKDKKTYGSFNDSNRENI
jgi:hypothetical protein